MIAIDEEDPAIAYATKFFGAGSGVVKATDFGETWCDIAAFGGYTQCWGLAIGRSDHRRVAMGTYTNDPARHRGYLSFDRSETWRRTTCGFTRSYTQNYGFLALDSLHVFAVQDEGAYALNWIDLPSYPVVSIAGELRDSATALPVRGALRLTQTARDSTAVLVRESDGSGEFRLDSLLVTGGRVGAFSDLIADPEIPYAQRSALSPSR